MTEVGVRTLKDSLSEYLRRAKAGERIVVTDHGRPIAVISSIEEPPSVREAWKLVASGRASWIGGKPTGSTTPPRLAGARAAEVVLEDRG